MVQTQFLFLSLVTEVQEQDLMIYCNIKLYHNRRLYLLLENNYVLLSKVHSCLTYLLFSAWRILLMQLSPRLQHVHSALTLGSKCF